MHTLMTKRPRFSNLHHVAVGRGPTKLEIEHHVASGHAGHRIWCDACMTTRGIAGRGERREPGREDEDPLVAIELHGTDDDDDDEDDEVEQKKLRILVAKDVKAGTYASTCRRKKGASEHATSWMASLLRRLQLCWQLHFFEVVLREGTVGQHATNGVAASAMCEVKGQTRTLKFAPGQIGPNR